MTGDWERAWSERAALSTEEVMDAAERALEELPTEFAGRLSDVAVIVDEAHPEGLMGIWDPEGGIERIVVFRQAHADREEVRRTVLHEVGHAFGMDEEQIRRLGYE